MNRSNIWEDLNKKIVQSPIESDRRHHISVWGVPGCGKTFVLKNYPLYSCIREDTLFSYITMNDGTNFNMKFESDQEIILISRINLILN